MNNGSILLVVSDLHVNSSTAMFPSDGFTLDDGQIVSPSPLNMEIYNRWLDLLAEVEGEAHRRDVPVYALINGEVIDDGVKHNSPQVFTQNPSDMMKLAHYVLDPLKSLVATTKDGHRGIWVTRGTEAHSGKSSWLDEEMARQLNAIPSDRGTFSHWKAYLEIDGVRVFAQHHGFSSYTTQDGKARAGKRNLDKLREEFNARGMDYPDLAFFGHHHRPLDTGDTDRNMRVITTASWQASNSYGHRIGGSPLEIGGTIVSTIPGRGYSIRHTNEQLDMNRERLWTNPKQR